MDYTSHLHRLFRLITLIHGQPGLTAPKLAAMFDLHERTIFRDVDIIKEAGIPLSHDPDTGGYAIRRDCFLRPIDLTLEEALALLLLADGIAGHEQIPHLFEARKAAEKLRAILPRQIGELVHEILPRTTLSLARVSNEPTADVYAAAQDAIADKRSLECSYESPRGQGASADALFRFDPYELYFGQRAWYAIGRHHGHDQIRTLKLSRFTCCRSTDHPYLIPDDFSLARHFGKAWRMMPSGVLHQIKLHFDPEVAETVADTHWHDTQQVDDHDDGSAVLDFEVDGLEEIIYWILGYGPHCRVLAPPELAARVREMHEAAASQYADSR